MALDMADVMRERRFLAAHPEWNIFSAGHGARWTAERDEDGEIVVAVRFTLRRAARPARSHQRPASPARTRSLAPPAARSCRVTPRKAGGNSTR